MKRICYIAALAVLTACGGEENKEAAAGTAEELPIVEVDVAAVRTVDQDKSYTANVEAFNSNNITPAGANRIRTITVDVGDRVRAGQVLVTLDASQAQQLKVNIDQLQREYDRAQQLLKIGSGTQATVDATKAQLDAAKAQYANVLENTTLTAPMSGVVTARNLDPGDMAAGTPVLTIGQISPRVKVLINVSEIDRKSVSAGMPVTVTLDAFPDEVFTANISRIYPQVDPATRTFQAEVQINNPEERIFPGMFARVNLTHGAAEHVVVPDRAIVKQPGSGNRYVFVYKNGAVSYNKVEIGRRLDDAYELLSGVENGDTVVIAGQSRLIDQARVQLKK